MKFIKVRNYNNGDILFINVDKILAVHTYIEEKAITQIEFSERYSAQVQETVAEVMMLIDGVTNEVQR